MNEKTGKSIVIPIDSVKLEGILSAPEKAKGIVVFAHGAGSSRLSPRNNFVASILNEHNLGTLLFDLLTEEEDSVYENRFDIPLITNRLVEATKWFKNSEHYKNYNIGYFGSSTGAAAALEAAAVLSKDIKAVVSRGGRPDLSEHLSEVISPTLLIVGGEDHAVIEYNQEAYNLLQAEKHIEIVGGATHLFEEEGALEKVANLASDWFVKHIS